MSLEAVWDLARALLLAAFIPVGGWLWRRHAARHAEAERRARLEAELIAAMAEACRRVIDCARWRLIQEWGQEGDRGYIAHPKHQAQRAAILLDDVEAARKRLWLALGMPDPDDPETAQLTSEDKRVLLALSQTMRFKIRDMSPEERAKAIAEHAQELELVPVSEIVIHHNGETN